MSFKILVTGGAGYLGSVMVPELLKEGHDVTVVDNFMFRQTSLNHCCKFDTFHVKHGDVRDERIMKSLLKNADFIFPLAALVGVPLCSRDEIGTITTNRDAIALIARLTSNEQKIVMPITNSGYGIGQKDIFCTEETPLNPISTYGKTKVEAEKIILNRGNAISFRLATVFGMSPRMRMDLLVNDFTYRAVKDKFIVIFQGHFKRNYLHIGDIPRVFIHAMNNFEKMKDTAYNVGLNDANLSKLELCEKIKKHVPDFVYLEAAVGEDPDKRDYIVSNEKIKKFGFEPQYSLDYGIQELIKGYEMLTNTIYGNV